MNDVPPQCEPTVGDPKGAMSSRRAWLRRTATVAAGALAYTWKWEPHWVEVVRRSLPIAGLPEQLLGARVVQLSDIHAGPQVDQRYLLDQAERVADLQPDLIVLTGDMMTQRSSDCMDKALDFIRALPKPRLGRLAILGNHDYGYGWYRPEVANMLCERLEKLDVQMLRNGAARVAGLQIAGVDDFYTRYFNLEATMAAINPSEPTLALVHNPDAVDQPQWQGYRGWILAGHTHGGQCKLPLLPPPILSVVNRRYVAGEYDLYDGRRLYINRGLGHLAPLRFNSRPEVTVFTLDRRHESELSPSSM